jgi:lysophospholipase L1-like esterase
MRSEPSTEMLRRAARPPADGLRALLTAFGAAGAAVAMTWLVPALAAYRPWVPGDPVPVVSVLMPSAAPRVVETESGELVSANEVSARVIPQAEAATPTPAQAPRTQGVDPASLPARPPGVPTPLVDSEHRGMGPFYAALHRAHLGEGLARASHWGDSTIAADGIAGTVRSRLQARFGDGGPGFLSAGMDPRWSSRPDVSVVREGEWTTYSVLQGGAPGSRYGLGGIVTTAPADGRVTLYAPKKPNGTRTPQTHVEVWYQAAPAAGRFTATAGGRTVGGGSAAADAAADRFVVKDVPEGFQRVTLTAQDGPVSFYGVVMETQGPGVTWDALGVVGVGSHSFGHVGRRHLAAQVARRDPDLIVVQLGGNELGHPSLAKGGDGYANYFGGALEKIRAGAPEAGCLLVTPLDQTTRKGGKVTTKPTLAALVAQQRAIAAAQGCAFWDAWSAMGGPGSMVAWSRRKPALAWTDGLHLSSDGQAIIGNLLADAIEAGYDLWLREGRGAAIEQAVAAERAARPVPAAPPPAVTPTKKAKTKGKTAKTRRTPMDSEVSTTTVSPDGAEPRGAAAASDLAAPAPDATERPKKKRRRKKTRALDGIAP